MMNFFSYNLGCLITSILMLFLVLFRFKQINLCIILLFASIFSIIWRSIKIIKGKDEIEKDNNHNYLINNLFFILDFTFAILGFLCVIFSKQINIRFIILTIFIFILSWLLYIIEFNKIKKNTQINDNKIISTSQTIHFCGHCYVILIVFLTFYL